MYIDIFLGVIALCLQVAGVIYLILVGIFRVFIPGMVLYNFTSVIIDHANSSKEANLIMYLLNVENRGIIMILGVLQVCSIMLQSYWFVIVLSKTIGAIFGEKSSSIRKKLN